MKKIKLLLFLCLFAAMANAAVYYVSPDGDNSDGLSWETAFDSPNTALSKITTSADEVWVKQGKYISSSKLDWKTGIDFYGGFIGNETERDQRNPDPSLTILEGTNEDRVLNTTQLWKETIWDGFTLQKGTSGGGGGGIMMQRNSTLRNCIVQDNVSTNYGGGGIIIQDSHNGQVKVINCIIRNNNLAATGSRRGGGIGVKEPDNSGDNQNVVIEGCIIEGNTATGLGAGLAIHGGAVRNCIIQNNSNTTSNGGGMFISVDDYPLEITNTVIANNVSKANGGGMFVANKSGYTGTLEISNCHIVNNESQTDAYSGGGGIYIQNVLLTDNITNCVFWGNTAPGSGIKHLKTAGTENSIKNCAFDTQPNGFYSNVTQTDCITIEQDNTGTEEGKLYANFKNPTTTAGLVESTEGIDWSPAKGSALIDAGASVSSVTTDILGTERPKGKGYDIGAYEYEDEGDPTGNKEVSASELNIYSVTNGIVVKSKEAQTVTVYSVTGNVVEKMYLPQGESTITLPGNQLYIIKAGNTVQRIVVK